MKKILFLILTVSVNHILIGQAPGSSPALSDSAGLGEAGMASSALDMANDLIGAKGWIEGYDPSTGRFIVVGSAPIQVKPNHPAFYQARRSAFEKAMLDAKKQLAGFLSQEVSREIESRYEEPSYENVMEEVAISVQQEPGIMDKAQLLIHSELDNLLKQRGVEPSSPEAAAEIKKILISDKFSDVIKAGSRAEVAGLFVYKIWEVAPKENTGDVAILAIMSEKTKQMAGAVLGKNPAPVGKVKSPLREYISKISKNTLISTHGIKVRMDENGQLNLIAFGQSKPKTKSSTAINGAKKKARISALGQLRSFAGEMVSATEAGGVSSSFEEFENNVSSFSSEESIKETVKASAEALKMPGITTLYNWSSIDQRSGGKIIGTILQWNLGNAMQANALRDQMSAIGGSRGGAGTSNLRPAVKSTPTPSKVPSAPHSPYSNQGLESEDDDF